MSEPAIVDLRGLLRGLHEHRVDYMLFGAIGMLFYGYVRNTEDVDLIVDPSQGNLDRQKGQTRPYLRRLEEAELYEVEKMRVPVLNRRTLIELKRRRGSHLDLADIEAIELLPDL